MPAKAGIQYAAPHKINHRCRGILDHPHFADDDGKERAMRLSSHFSRYFFISARSPSRRSARAMP